MEEDITPPFPEAKDVHWGYIMGLTGAYLALVDQLEANGHITRSATIDGLTIMREAMKDLPHAQNWLDTTIKQISLMGGKAK